MLFPVSMVIMIKITFCAPMLQSRRCNPVYCTPGYEIISCIETGTLFDECRKCKEGYKQPDYISSHMNHTTCFLPINNSCLAWDITYSRVYKPTFCESLVGCKCDVLKCYHGDPCLCTKTRGCPPNKYLSEDGVCESCPKDTEKNGTGCGPCLFVNKNKGLEKMSLKYDTTTVTTTPTTTQKLKADKIDHIDITYNTPQVTTRTLNAGSCETNNSAIPLAAIGAVAACLLIVVIVLAILLNRTRRRPCRNVNQEYIVPRPEQVPLNNGVNG